MNLRWSGRARLIAFLLGAAFIIISAQWTNRIRGEVGPAIPGATFYLSEGETLSWDLRPERTGLSGLYIQLEQPLPQGASLTVMLGDEAIGGLALFEVTAPPLAIGIDGSLLVDFAPERVIISPHVPTATLIVQMRAQGLVNDARIGLRGFEDRTSNQTTAFVPVYVRRPFDQIWPVSQMAAGRPGLFGWPPLYALLAYGFLALLLHALWQFIWEDRRRSGSIN